MSYIIPGVYYGPCILWSRLMPVSIIQICHFRSSNIRKRKKKTHLTSSLSNSPNEFRRVDNHPSSSNLKSWRVRDGSKTKEMGNGESSTPRRPVHPPRQTFPEGKEKPVIDRPLSGVDLQQLPDNVGEITPKRPLLLHTYRTGNQLRDVETLTVCSLG